MERSRRRVLATTASLGLGCLAGCAGSDGGNGDDNETGNGDDNGNGTESGSSEPVPELSADAEEVATLFVEDSEMGGFGESVALDGDTAVVGSMGTRSVDGSAYVFERSDGSWEQRTTLEAANGDEVVIDGETIMVAADNNTVVVYERDGDSWDSGPELSVTGDGVNYPIVIDGDTALVGSDDGFYDGRPVDVFERVDGTWEESTTLTPESGLGSGKFGNGVALSDGTALVAADNADPTDSGTDGGAVYVFDREEGAWTQREPITRGGLGQYDAFGRSVTLEGDRALVMQYNSGEHEGSSVFVYGRSGDVWEEQGRLTQTGDSADFGETLALVGSTTLVGSPSAINVTAEAYVFKETDGSWEREIRFVKGGEGKGFADAVAMSGDTALVGRPYDDENGEDAGAVYVYE
ncbi:hypothetical protein CP556_24130 [Natrinema sp. CBA1119]|uniref:FG-GAP repeat protein n=1 Tax=Natrinema sp. CBA1119 TaxID=1608465 RepID=UPI000BF7822F|nr:FG-GAP repeat protein [Natrinema sp. CBA1119]PGF14130.1 hypothetical protein CP556_24130 [Natrinema sp. CBA1119]